MTGESPHARTGASATASTHLPAASGSLRELTAEECVQLLRTERVGRVAVVTPAGWPLIRPVDYIFDERSRSVVFRSRPGSKLHALAHADRASFEIDSAADPCASWSVIITGVVETVTQAPEVARLEHLALNTRVPVEPRTWLRIRPNVISGRRAD
jgi:uncharacterized protein